MVLEDLGFLKDDLLLRQTIAYLLGLLFVEIRHGVGSLYATQIVKSRDNRWYMECRSRARKRNAQVLLVSLIIDIYQIC